MVILSAIGRFFKKIWDWIKQTAWIQPLLIVGLIFGVIFSIPAIVNAVKNGKTEKNKYAAYYNHFKLSLKGEANSEADKFTTRLTDIMSSGGSESSLKAFKDDFGKHVHNAKKQKAVLKSLKKDLIKTHTKSTGQQSIEKKNLKWSPSLLMMKTMIQPRKLQLSPSI
jgi:hypothetical protein